MSPTIKPIRILTNSRDVIDLLSIEGPMTPAEIAERVDLPRPSVYRLVDGLNAVRLTETMPDSRIRLDLRWLHLADSARRGMTEWSEAGSILQELSEATAQTTYLTVRRGFDAVCVEWSPGRGVGVLLLKPGRSLPLNAGAAGRAIVAFDDEVAEAFLETAPFARFTPTTITTADELRQDIERTRKRGYSISDEDLTVGIGALGVPLVTAKGSVACISMAGLAHVFRHRQTELLAALREAQQRLT